MSDITLRNKIVYDANIGAIICRTPRTSNDEVIDDLLVDRHCMLVRNKDEFIKYFGDPYINPTEYSDAIIALDLVQRNINMYISSIDEMKHFDDGFDIPYNGYTEFYFLDSERYRTVGYKIKSGMKFCQPIIQSKRELNILTLYVSLFLLDRSVPKKYIDIDEKTRVTDVNSFDTLKLYTTYTLEFDVSKVLNEHGVDVTKTKDVDVINALLEYGIELKPLNTYGDTDLIDKFAEFTKFTVVNDQNAVYSVDDSDKENIQYTFLKDVINYTYDLHTDNYAFDFSDDDKVVNTYKDAAERLRHSSPEPLFVSLGRLYKSFTVFNDKDDQDKFIIRSVMCDLDPYNYSVVHYHLLSIFDPAGTKINMETLSEEYSNASNTYLFISAPDIPSTSLNKWLSVSDEFSNVVDRKDQYNCDMFYGYIIEYMVSTLYYEHPERTMISAATLAMYNALINDIAYMTNEIGSLNISNASVKSYISESTAKKLANNRCNTAVMFDTGSPSIYGNRSLSLLPNLRYSHISRNYILIRRLISEFLETKKFVLNTVYNIDACTNYITSNILEQFKMNGVLNRYEIERTMSHKTVYYTITLYFMQMAGSLKLDFTI